MQRARPTVVKKIIANANLQSLNGVPPRQSLSAGVPFPAFLAFTSVFYFINLTNSRHWVKGARARAINNTTTASALTTARARARDNGTTGQRQRDNDNTWPGGLTCFTFALALTTLTVLGDVEATRQNPQALFNLTKSKETARRINNETDEGPLWARKPGSVSESGARLPQRFPSVPCSNNRTLLVSVRGANSQCLSNVFLNSVRCDNSCGRVLDRLTDGADRRRRQGEVRKGG